jgi:hypothetical protein
MQRLDIRDRWCGGKEFKVLKGENIAAGAISDGKIKNGHFRRVTSIM